MADPAGSGVGGVGVGVSLSRLAAGESTRNAGFDTRESSGARTVGTSEATVKTPSSVSAVATETIGTSEVTVKTPSSVSAAVTETVWASTTTFDCLPAPVTSRDAALAS